MTKPILVGNTIFVSGVNSIYGSSYSAYSYYASFYYGYSSSNFVFSSLIFYSGV